MKKTFNNLKGFTLIELLVVIAIIGILGAIVYAPFQTARRKGRDAQKIVEMKNLQSTLFLYADSHNGEYPPSLCVLQESMTDKLPQNTNIQTNPDGTCPSSGGQADLTKYNYTSYVRGGKILAFHLYTHLETNSPVLASAAKCSGASNLADPSKCFFGEGMIYAVESTIEPQDNSILGAFFTDHSQDSDDICATDETKCIYDLKG